MPVPKVEITTALKEALTADGYDINDFLALFRDWKTDWNKKEYDFWFFGKDGRNKFPKRNNQMVLSHVHLPPEKNKKDQEIWQNNYRNESRKTSNSVLFYAGCEKLNRYLLLYLVVEPHGHNFQKMHTSHNKEIMNILADQAQEYIHSGKIRL